MTEKKKTEKSKSSSAKKDKSTSCWSGYERVPGKEPGSKGSCKKK